MFHCLITLLFFSLCASYANPQRSEVQDESELILPDALHQLEIVNGTDADEGEFPFAVSFS